MKTVVASGVMRTVYPHAGGANGGPDRRFQENRKLPIALYEEISFTSPTGLNETIQVSGVGTGGQIAAAIRSLSLLLSSA